MATAAASYSLGEIALADGERMKAKRLFEAVSQTGGEIGRKARERYVATETFFENGRVVVVVENSTGYELRDIAVRIDAIINGNRVPPRLEQVVRLAPHAFKVVRTGIRYRETDTVEVEVEVVQAETAA